MKVKPKEIMVNLPAAHLFQSEDEMASFASAINTIIHGKVKIKYEVLGTLGGQFVGLFYIQRNLESQEINDEFRRLIEQEEMQTTLVSEDKEDDDDYDPDWMKRPSRPEDYYAHKLCTDCLEYEMLHQKGEDHCVCGETWNNGCRLCQK
jgi:hypothetical protein